MSSLVGPSSHRRFPRVSDAIGEDPGRYLDRDLEGARELIEARIRGIDFLETARAWIAVERNLGRDPEGGPRPEVLELLQEREAYLEEHGDRDERVDLKIESVAGTQTGVEGDLDELETSYRHEGCEGLVERRGKLAYHCTACDHAVPRSAVLEVVEAEGVSA